jgi:hypothetical protein
MSIGNTRSEGNKSINFPWQLKMLLGQECACDQLKQISSNTDQVEYLLSSILTTLQAETEYEAKFVKETCPGPPVTERVLLEVRVWDQDTSTWVGAPTYYLPGDPTPTTIGAGCTIEYLDAANVLGLILGAIQAGNLILQDIDNNTDGLETILTNIFNLYSAGQQVCADSLSVTLCTEQSTTLSGILTELQGTLDVNITNATLAVTQSGAWTVTSNQGTSPWVVSGTVALDAATLAALETITVNQGGSWTVALDPLTLASLESITVQNGPGPAAVNIQDGGNSITVDDGGGSITVDGAVTVSATDLDIRNLDCATDSVSVCASGTPLTATGGALNVNIASGVTLEVNLDQSSDQVQVYGSDLTAPIATDASGHLQVDILTIPEVEIKNDAGNPIPVTGTVTITDGSGPITVDGTVTANQGTSPWVVSGTVTATPTGTQDVNIISTIALPVTDNGGSLTVDGTVAATQSGTWNINNISGTISLPTGSATAANQATEITSLNSIDNSLISIDNEVQAINNHFIAVTRTPALIRATGVGTISAGARSISVFNSGSAAGSILGVAGNILPGEVFEFSAGGENDTLSAFAYDGTGTTLVITSIV